MRFPTWSTLTNTFTVSTAALLLALLFLIPATNAIIPTSLEITFSHPTNGPHEGETDYLHGGTMDTITWYVP
jgi:hypothetical protein